MSKSEIKALAAIKKYCKECSGGSETEASRCHLTNCPLWNYKPTIRERSTAIAKKEERKGK